MHRPLILVSVVLISLALLLTTPRVLVFYDAPEYVEIVSTHSLLESMKLGHPPIHPVFMGVLWMISQLTRRVFGVSAAYSGNISALVSGVTSIWLFLKLSGFFLEKRRQYLATLIFSLLPAIWIVNTNLMVESLLLTLFLLTGWTFAQFSTRRTAGSAFLYVASVFLLVGTHIQAIVWLPALFALPFLLSKNRKAVEKQSVLVTLFLTGIGVLFSLLFYALVFWLAEREVVFELKRLFFGRAGEFFDVYTPGLSLLRAARNLAVSLIRGMSTLAAGAFLFVVFSRRKDKFFLLGVLLFSVSVGISGSVWTGDFMIRRIVFSGVLLSLLLTKYFPKGAVLLGIYLVPMTLANSLLYISTRADMPFDLMRRAERALPPGNVLIQTHYVKPFTYKYDGEMFWVGHNSLDSLVDVFKKGDKRVFLDSQALFAPYLLYVGNNLHITSLGKFGESETKPLFSRFSFDLVAVEDAQQRIFVYEAGNEEGTFESRVDRNKRLADRDTDVVMGLAKPGSPVFLYTRGILERIHRERIDYGDLATWLWVLLSGKRDASFWTYADRGGVFVMPIPAAKREQVFVQGEGIERRLLITAEDIREL